MTDFPDVKLKALVQFPAQVYGGTAIKVTQSSGIYTIDVNYTEMAPAITPDPANQTVLLWNTLSGVYTLAPITMFGSGGSGGGIEEAPTDGAIYARKNSAWIMLYASDVPPPGPGGGDFTTSLSGPGSMLVPAGKTTMIAEAWGGGGSGSGYGGTPANEGGGGGGYSRFSATVAPGQTIYFSVGLGGGDPSWYDGYRGGDSWVNPLANVKPTSIGCVGGGGGGGGANGGGGGGSGTIGSINYNGGNGWPAPGGGGGGGAGSGGSGANAAADVGGIGGTPDGGAGGNGATGLSTPGSPGLPIGGAGGGGKGSVSAGGAAANGQIRLSFS